MAEYRVKLISLVLLILSCITPLTVSGTTPLELTAEEKRWLSEKHVVRVRIADYPPYMMNTSEPEGMSVEYIRSIAKRIGFQVQFVPAVTPWNAALQDVAGPHERYDMLPTMQRTPDRERQFALTNDYLSAPWVIIMRTDSPFYSGLEALKGKTIAVERGFVIKQLLQKQYPDIDLEEVPSAKDALLAVATAQADAYIANLAVSSYLIRSNRLHNLGVMAPTPFGVNTQAMAIRPDWKVLAGLIDKGLAAMSAEEKAAIDQRWGMVEFKPVVDYVIVWQIAGAATAILLFVFLWNRRLAREIAFRKSQQEKIEYLAYHDALTDLPNRTLGHDRIVMALAHANRETESIAVLFIDIKKFKLINDMHGHPLGDRVLKEFANRLLKCVRAQDTVCRLAADTFMILLTGSQSPQQVLAFCQRVTHQSTMPYNLSNLHLRLDISIGVALSTGEADSAEVLMRHADTALHKAKVRGSSEPVFFEQRMNDELKQFVEIREALRLAIDREEFELYYQPKIDLQTGRATGMEALIRWRRDGVNLVSPAAFIHIAEESGLIIPIGKWVLKQACRQTALWHASGFGDLVIALNVSAVQLVDEGFKEDVMDALSESSLDPRYLELEITESILLQDFSSISQAIDYWREAGIRLSIDDFGTGYSNFSYLQRFRNIDKLKIDQSFTSQITHSPSAHAIVQAMINIAHTLNLSVVAEGVEDASTRDQLVTMGCNEVQGYLYSRPLPAREFERWCNIRIV